MSPQRREPEWAQTEPGLEAAAYTALQLHAGVTVVLARRAGVVARARALADTLGLTVTAEMGAASIVVRLDPRSSP